MTFLLSFIALSALLVEGWLLARFLVPSSDRLLGVALALPLAAVSNVLLVFLYTVIDIPLTPLTMGLGHGAILLLLCSQCFSFARYSFREPATSNQLTSNERPGILRRILRTSCFVLLANITLFSAAHALILPSFSIDSLTNWTMRAQISFVDQSIAFDRTEDRGMAKPQYPFLTHALQIAANQGQPRWSDRAANAATWLLSLSAFTALFLMIKRLRGVDVALIALTTILSIPLLSIHLAQGYGDIHLVEYLLLAMMALAMDWKSRRSPNVTLSLPKGGWMILSAIFVLGALWTKSEGLFFGFLPWMILLLLFHRPLTTHVSRLASFAVVLLPLFLFLPFPLLLLSKGLPLTPHGTDTTFGFRPEGLSALWPSLFGLGSFGILWYVLPVATLLAVVAARRSPSGDVGLLLWGWLIVAMNLVIYLFTPNVVFLQNGESFFRQMLPAAALIVLSCALILDVPRPRRAAATVE